MRTIVKRMDVKQTLVLFLVLALLLFCGAPVKAASNTDYQGVRRVMASCDPMEVEESHMVMSWIDSSCYQECDYWLSVRMNQLPLEVQMMLRPYIDPMFFTSND